MFRNLNIFVQLFPAINVGIIENLVATADIDRVPCSET